MSSGLLQREQWVDAPLTQVFGFFSEARNLDRITPRWLGFKLLNQSTPRIEAGTLIQYRLAWHGLPMRWTTLIEEWTPPTKFVDVQLKGPYGLWRHTHTFAESKGGTLVRDTVEYRVPFGMLGRLFAGGMVRRDVELIFDYRVTKIGEIFRQGLETDRGAMLNDAFRR
jgi:ligand-binding SRPBCC domain-containing protein